MTLSDLHFREIPLAVVWRTDYRHSVGSIFGWEKREMMEKSVDNELSFKLIDFEVSMGCPRGGIQQ